MRINLVRKRTKCNVLFLIYLKKFNGNFLELFLQGWIEGGRNEQRLLNTKLQSHGDCIHNGQIDSGQAFHTYHHHLPRSYGLNPIPSNQPLNVQDQLEYS